ncbi:MAG: SPOR domain-containing protein [Gammaproteobacteria bacterium]|nr:SPOR domain-containing protein [Gammaproteobacteria bacterium]
MEQKLKERLVGAAVLVAVAVIFIPIIFTDSQDTEVILGSNIPEKPETNFNSRIVPVIESDDEPSSAPNDLEKVESENIESGKSQNDAMVTEQKVVAEKVISASENKAEKQAIEQKQATTEAEGSTTVGLSAWIVQLGSFTEEDNAQSLNTKLRKAGYPSFVEPIKKDGKISYRVRVRPEIKRSEADALLKKLKDKMQLDGIVVSYP